MAYARALEATPPARLGAAGGPAAGTMGPRRPEEATTSTPRPETGPETASFEDFYLAHFDRLVRLAFVLTGSRELSEDLVQDSFVRLHRHYDRIETPDRYVRQIVVNACRSHFRKSGRERERRPLLYVIDGADPAAGGELADVLMELPYRQRAAVVLRYYSDLSEIEIAEVLGCRPGTVGSLIHRGLARLREALNS
ncbi:MAG: SigE family RNA polymerase sigma factor [Acidimicrobiales bacterium]